VFPRNSNDSDYLHNSGKGVALSGVYTSGSMTPRKTGSNATSVLISLRLPRAKIEKLKAVAAGEGSGYQTILKRFVDEGLENTPAPPQSVVMAVQAELEKKRKEREAAAKLKPKPKPKKPVPTLPGGLTDDDLNDMMDGLE